MKNGGAKLIATFIVGDVALGIMFVLLKLLKFVDFEWKWATCPFWAPLLALCVLALTTSVWFAIGVIFGRNEEEDEKKSEDGWRDV